MTRHRGEACSSTLWVGLAECIPDDPSSEVFEGGSGAFVNVLGWALSKELFIKNVIKKLKEHSATLLSLEDVESYEDRVKHWEIDEELVLAAEAAPQNGDVILATFDIYMSGDE